MLPTNIFYRTFFVRAGQYGTAFTLDVDGQEFLITAAHLLSGGMNDREFKCCARASGITSNARLLELVEGT